MKWIEKIWLFMKSIVGFIKKIVETGITFLKVIVENGYRIKTKKLDEKEDFIVLANGPTLNNDIENLKRDFQKSSLVVVNQFSTTKYFQELKPAYYVMLDGQYFFDELKNQILKDHLNILTNEVDWALTLYVPSRYKKSYFVNTVSQNSNISIELFNTTLAKGGFEKINWFLFDHNYAMLQSQNVLVSAIFNLIKNGAKNIYLFGAQNDWHLNAIVGNDNYVYLKQPHFYNKGEYKIQHKNIYTKEPAKFHELLASSVKALKGYHPIQAYAKQKDCDIFNCSKSSFIDAFPRLNDEEFIKKVEK